MIKATRPAILNPLNNIKLALFHSTPVLERKRRTGRYVNKDSTKKYNQYVKRCRKLHSKQELLRNVGAFAEELFQSWKSGSADKDSKAESWFTREFVGKKSKGGWTTPKEPSYRDFDFCDEDVSEGERIFCGSFDGGRFFYSSFVEEDSPGSKDNFRKSWRWSHIDLDEEEENFRKTEEDKFRKSWKWRNKYEEEDNFRKSSKRHTYEEEYYEIPSEPNISESDRLALGLCASGPLKMEDVKNAYRVCALKWHPDRHQGKTKAVAEEKFKACNAAYQSLCDKLCPA